MLGVVILTLTLVAGQVSSHPSAFTLDDNDGQVYTGIMNEGEGDIEIVSVEKPFEWNNLKSVAAGELYQGDILLTEEQWAALRERKALDSVSQRWTEGADGYPLVPYIFHNTTYESDILAGIDHWTEHTCIKFEETTNTDQPHLQFINGGDGRCYSNIGMIYFWNGQTVSIGSGCNSLGIVAHEIGHAIGFWHEQARSDRDDYVVIVFDEIIGDYTSQFDKQNDNNYNVPYDYSSDMHYGMHYFTKDGNPTIISLDPLAQELIGSRNDLTHRDKLLANRMYNCTGKWLVSCGLSSDPCLNDGYTGKNCACLCPPGTSGTNCEVNDGDYYAKLRNPRSEKITTETTITVKTPMNASITFVKWVVPPTCKSAKVDFTFGDMYTNCVYQYLNVRKDPTDYTGEKLCASDVSGGTIFTSETGIIITMTNWVTYGFEKTLWEAVVTFEDITGCSIPDTTTQLPTTTPVNPTTTPPTNPPTTTENTLTTTKCPPRKVPCMKNPKKITMTKGAAITITTPGYPKPYSANRIRCGWKIKAKWPAKLNLTCDYFDLNGRDVLKVNRNFFKHDAGPSSMISKWLGIRFFSKKRASGPGFTCVVTAI